MRAMKTSSIAMTLARLCSGAVAAGMLFVFAVGMLGSGQLESQVVNHGLPCLFRSATGLVCPLCGMTHGIAALGAGDIGAALAAHPLAPFIFVFTLWLGASLAIKGHMRFYGRELNATGLLTGVGIVWVVNLTSFLLH